MSLNVWRVFSKEGQISGLIASEKTTEKYFGENLHNSDKTPTFALVKYGEMAEWSIAAVLKTVEGHTSGGSNPSLSAQKKPDGFRRAFSVYVPLSKFLRILSGQCK